MWVPASFLIPTQDAIGLHQARLRHCSRCPHMQGPPVTGVAVASPVMLIGQAPGPKEIELRRPFAWTAGNTLFRWFRELGIDEDTFRKRVYMAAVCRCFPGKLARGGDRVPSAEEIARCAAWLDIELGMLRPSLLILAGKLAIGQFMAVPRLEEVVGRQYRITHCGVTADAIPLPHPSGASVWPKVEPGRSLLRQALQLIDRHPAWKALCDSPSPEPSPGL